MPVCLHTESSMNLGGQELRILIEMEGLRPRGFDTILAARPGSMILAEARRRGLNTYAVPMRGSFDPVAVMAFRKIISDERVNIINTHGSKDGWSAGLAAKSLGIRVIRSRHIANPIRRHFFGRMVYTSLCDAVVTTSESIKQGMASRGVPVDRITSVPTGVDMRRFDPDMPKGTFRADTGIPAAAPLVGMVSVMRGDKGPDVFIRAAEVVLNELPEAYAVMVGDGWMLDRLRESASASKHADRLKIAGYRTDIPEVMADLDVIVLPAKIPEGVPQVILQAHSMRLPVVASEIGGINEVAINGETALTAPPGDYQAVAELVIRLLTDNELATKLSANGNRLVRDKYTVERMLDTMEGIYRGMLAKR